nr:ATP-binding protein [Cryobacterium sp. Y29]
MNDSVGVLKLSSPPNDVNDVHDFVEAQLSQHPDLDDLDRMKVLTALIELGSNVIQHANNGSGVTCTLTLSVEDEQIHAQLSDSSEIGGIKLAAGGMPEDVLAESGRGIAFIQALVDDLHYTRIGDRNLWSISKKRSRSASVG